jgi:hypothetical protein
MMKRHQQILIGVLAVQIILGVVVFWPQQAASSTGERLFPDLEAADIVALTIVDNVGEQVVLRKEGDAWVLPEAGNYPANESAVTPLLENIASVNSATLVARSESSQAQLQVTGDTFQRRLDFETSNGETYTIYLGSAPRYTATHFRVAGQVETYLSTDLTTWEFNTRLATWIDTAYTSLDQETLISAVLENANGTFTFVKVDDAWTLADLQEDETMASGVASTIVRNASNLSMTAPLGTTEEAYYGLDDPNAVVTLETEGGTTYVLTVGAMLAEDNNYVVKWSDSPFYVEVAQYSVSAMVENARDAFLDLPPTSTPEPAP